MTKPPKKTQVQPIRATADERAEWKAAADAAGLTLSDYVRRAINNSEVGRRPRGQRKEPPPADPDLLFHLGKIGGNLNQLTRYANRYASRADAMRILNDVRRIRQQMKRLVGD